ncbi:ABC transporter substrate-binding protein [Sinomonas sp. ASV486]|uniref:ABC transporter substrate-binding protein n=1 Tax=Sinomonas sp. ASV486 TaxID=3051170 RepID=UPI0027DE3C36|nr:ABC transporter substrate-binding protein [Sinomonas sp. ASV486]MDQ4489805.1 ABC transporter substrate-binding protein [Sinomonas sp. ASV486]
MSTVRSDRRRSAKMVAAVAGALALVVATSACGGGKSTASTSHTFVMATQTLPSSLDATAFSGGTRPLESLLDSELFNYSTNSCDTAPSADKLTGMLVDSYQSSADRKSITVTLKSNIKSQYGNALTADDVKWSFERGVALSPIVKFLSFNSAHFSKTNAIEVVSPTQFKLNLDQPTPLDLAMWTIPTFSIYDSTEAKKHTTGDDQWAKTWLATNSAGYGPWKVDSFDQGNQITVSKNPGWPGQVGNYDRVVLKQITSSSDQAQLLQSGSINYARDLTWSQFSDLKSSGKVDVYQCSPISRDWLVLQQKDPHLADVRVRQAISMAIDRDALVKGAYSGLSTPALDGMLASELPSGANVQKTSYNVEQAKQLMSQAGLSNGFDLTLNYNATQPGSQVDQLAILLQSQLKQIGINVKLNKLASGNDLQSTHSSGNYQAELWSSSSALPSGYFDAGLLEPGSPNTTWGYTNKDYTDAVNALGAAVPGSPEANAATEKIANMNISDMVVVQLASTPNIFAMTKGLQGIDKALGTIPIQPQPAGLSAP